LMGQNTSKTELRNDESSQAPPVSEPEVDAKTETVPSIDAKRDSETGETTSTGLYQNGDEKKESEVLMETPSRLSYPSTPSSQRKPSRLPSGNEWSSKYKVQLIAYGPPVDWKTNESALQRAKDDARSRALGLTPSKALQHARIGIIRKIDVEEGENDDDDDKEKASESSSSSTTWGKEANTKVEDMELEDTPTTDSATPTTSTVISEKEKDDEGNDQLGDLPENNNPTKTTEGLDGKEKKKKKEKKRFSKCGHTSSFYSSIWSLLFSFLAKWNYDGLPLLFFLFDSLFPFFVI